MTKEKIKPRFITVEGCEGAGKSSAIKSIKEFLQERNISLIVTREPGGTIIAENIRQILLNHSDEQIHSDTELLLMFASRAQHLAEVIRPALAQGRWVVCDRFTDASYAYQGGGRKIETQRIAALEQWVQGDLRPDLVLVMDVDPEIGLMRAREKDQPDRIEIEEIDFFTRVRNCYLDRAKKNREKYRIIDANQTINSVNQQLINVLKEYLVNLV